MPASLGSLVVSLGLDSAEFTKGLTKAEYDAQRSMKNIKREAEEMGKVVAIAAVAAGAAVVAMGVHFIDTAASLDDMAEKTGASVEELSKLSQQAFISGTSLETVEATLIQLSKHLQGAGEDSKNTGRALAALGLNAADLKNLDTAQALRIVAGELNKYADGSGKAALAIDLLGKAGAQALPYLKDLANDQALATTITAKQAAQAEELQKALRRIALESSNAKQAIALDLIPYLLKMIEQFNQGKEIAGGFWNALLLFGTQNPFRTAAENVAQLRKELEQAQGFAASKNFGAAGGANAQANADALKKQLDFAKLLQRQEALAIPGGDTRGELQRFGLAGGVKPPLDYKSPVGDDVKKKLEDVKRLYEEVAAIGRSIDVNVMPPAFKDLDKDRRNLEDIKKVLTEGRKDWIAYADAVFNAADAENTAAAAGPSFTESAEKLKEKLLDLIDPLRAIKREHEEIDTLVATGWMTESDARLAKLIPSVRELLQPLTNIHNEIQKAWEAGLLTTDQMQDALLRVQPALEKTDDMARSLGLTFSSALEGLVFDTKKGIDALKLLEAAALDVAKALFRKSVTEPLLNSVKGFDIGSLLKGLLGGDSRAAVTPEFRADTLSGSYATGTDYVPSTGIYKLHQGEKVTPAGENSGGVVVHYAPVIDARGADSAAVARLEVALRQTRRDIYPIVRNATRRTVG